ncbi:uncharacterized protein LOC103851425 [Brassica rapa]|uniref:uncharacterized protein LOC103851425 n=1 Tax=Brassica campestris TaxID=3711 RepID=UPI00142DCBAC|nr:uncharacterized protein LOC103851425 [Brassica rapa]XP_048602504.1 uncharacterized protein LOC125581320 [Brassica napus]XP_048605692.1 uncharacterized protein LOC106427303 [Brassica napus]
MWCVHIQHALLFLTILLLLVEASLGRYIPFKIPDGYVRIRWDIMNETRGSYSANVTITDYLTNHDIEGPWALRWKWNEDEILLSTVGVIGTQLGKESSVGDNKWPLNSNLPPRREKVVPKCCEDDVIVPWYGEANLEKSSSSFQITVGRVGIEYYPPKFVFTTPRSKLMCFPMMRFTNTRGYLKTWTAMCGLFLEFLKTDNEDL